MKQTQRIKTQIRYPLIGAALAAVIGYGVLWHTDLFSQERADRKLQRAQATLHSKNEWARQELLESNEVLVECARKFNKDQCIARAVEKQQLIITDQEEAVSAFMVAEEDRNSSFRSKLSLLSMISWIGFSLGFVFGVKKDIRESDPDDKERAPVELGAGLDIYDKRVIK